MEEIYYWVGFIVFYISFSIGCVITVGFMLKVLIDEFGKRFKSMWIILEYVYNKKEFKKWKKKNTK